jgi:NTP pyrophosphatase (non-canonical NTP hydrolase)
MEIQTYQFKATRTLAEIDGNILDDLHMVIGMQTEVAEIADVYKKHIAYKKPIDYVNIKEELGDAMWYIANLCNIHGWDLRDILATNIAKLKSRYPEKFTEENALNRDLVIEREILEGGNLVFDPKNRTSTNEM